MNMCRPSGTWRAWAKPDSHGLRHGLFFVRPSGAEESDDQDRTTRPEQHGHTNKNGTSTTRQSKLDDQEYGKEEKEIHGNEDDDRG